MTTYSYMNYMGEENPYIVMNISTKNPIELSDFVGGLTSISRQYERYIKNAHPELPKEANLYVREVRSGSIELDIIPWVMGGGLTGVGATAIWAIDKMDKVQILDKFLKDFKTKFNRIKSGQTEKDDNPAELRDWANAVKAIAKDENGKTTLSLATYENGEKQVRAAFRFSTNEARQVDVQVDKRLRELGAKTHPPHERVLMVFTRADITESAKNKKSGERVIINKLSERALPIMYSSEMAEAKIKHEIRSAEFPFKTGFVVDVYVEMSASGKPLAYAVTGFHNTIDLGDD